MTWRALGVFVLVGTMACSGPEQGPGAGGSQEPNKEQPKGSKEDSSPGPESDGEEDKPLDCSKLESTGLEIGDVAPNLVLEDGEGKEVRLHDYCNDTVILIASEY